MRQLRVQVINCMAFISIVCADYTTLLAAGGGYQDISALSSIAKQMRDSFPSFGGVMLWSAFFMSLVALVLICPTTGMHPRPMVSHNV